MARSTKEGAEHIYKVAERFKQAALLSVDSLFTPGTPIWTASALDELNRLFVLQPDLSDLSFDQKLAKQLSGASDGAVQLMAEIVLMHVLISLDTSGNRKREVLRHILSQLPERRSIQIPPEIDQALDYGICSPGTFFNTGRDRQLRFLIEWMRDWRQLPSDECIRLLADPWGFKEYLWTINLGSAWLQRNAILHLLFPDSFERIMSPDHKAAVVAAFADRIGGLCCARAMDNDRALLEIREALASEFGDDFDYYDTPEVAATWMES